MTLPGEWEGFTALDLLEAGEPVVLVTDFSSSPARRRGKVVRVKNTPRERLRSRGT